MKNDYLKKLTKAQLLARLKEYEKYPDLGFIYERMDNLHGIIVLINNYMEKPDYSKWHIKGALNSLQSVLIDIQSDIEESFEE